MLDPLSIMSAVQGVTGLAQTIGGFFGARKARKQLENLQTPTYTPAKSITDYYTESKQRYNQSPYASTLYNTQMQNINRNTAQGIAGLQSRRMGIGGISSLIQSQNDATLKAAAAAEQQKEQRFGQYGQAAGAMAGEERQAFNINKMMPYEKRYNLLAMKAQGNNQAMNAGMQNMFGAGQSYLMGQVMQPQSTQAIPDYSQHEYGNPKPSTYKIPLAKY